MNIQTLSAFLEGLPKYSGRQSWISATFVAALLLLSACSLPQPVMIGDSAAQVVAVRGTPTHRYRVGSEELLEYMHGPYGQETWMARIGNDGKLISFEQVLTDEKFATLQLGVTNKQDVLHAIGLPANRLTFRCRNWKPGLTLTSNMASGIRSCTSILTMPASYARWKTRRTCASMAGTTCSVFLDRHVAQARHQICGLSFSTLECSLFKADR